MTHAITTDKFHQQYGKPAKARSRRRHQPGVMNKMERAYADLLDLRKAGGQVERYFFERVTLKLADDTRYTPDFMVITRDGFIEFHEVKGHMEDDAWVKLKVSDEMFRWATFKRVTKRANKHGGGWVIKTLGEDGQEVIGG